jgi:RNA polymerase sigma-32 factor
LVDEPADDSGSVIEADVLEPEAAPTPKPLPKPRGSARAAKPKNALLPARDATASGALERLDPLRVYMDGVRRYRLLTPEEERDLATRFRETGDPKLAHSLVTANLRLVVKIANEYRSHWTNLLDLIQEGNIGLMQAVKRFDPLRGVRLSSYSQYWIRAYIIYYLLANFRLVKVGTTQAQRKLFFRLQKARDELIAMGITPGPKLLAEKLDVTEQEVHEMSVRLDSPEVSIDATAPGKESPPLRDSLPGHSPGPELDVSAAELHEQIRAALRRFGETLDNERERVLWDERLLAEEPATLQDIGARFQISRERARQLEERLKKRCREHLERELGVDVRLAFLD